MGSFMVINDDFTLEVEEDDDEQLEIVYEKHIRISTEPECNVQKDPNFHINFTHIKEEIDFEDNYIEEGYFIDLDKIKTEIEPYPEEYEVVETEEIEDSLEEQKVENCSIEKERAENNHIEGTIDASVEADTKTDGIQDKTEGESTEEVFKANSVEEETKTNSIEEKNKTDSVEEETKENGIEADSIKEETKGCKVEEESKADNIEEEPKGNSKEKETIENNIEVVCTKEETKKASIEEKPKEGNKTEQPPKKFLNTTVNNIRKTKLQINHPSPNQRRISHPTEHCHQPLDRRKRFYNQNKHHHPSQNDTNFPSWKRRKKSPSKNWRRRLGSRSFYYDNRERVNQTGGNTPAYNQCQSTSPDWQTYSTILGVLNQALGQQTAQNSHVNERSLVPYVPQSGASRRKRMKNNWFDPAQNRPNVWASGFESAAYAPSSGFPAQLQTYTNILMAFSQFSNGGFVQNNQTDMKFQMSCLNVFRS